MFSIIIPTHNRSKYLKRILNYYDSFSIDISIIVVDSSPNEIKGLNKQIVASFLNKDIRYIEGHLLMVRKIAEAVNYVNTKYCVICADDDFITPNGIKQSLNFLEKNPDFTIAYGHFISFYLKTDKEGKQQFCWTPAYPSQESITFSDPKDRLAYYLSNYPVSTLYAVYRTNFMKTVFEEILKFTNDSRFGELSPSMLTSIYGKIKFLEKVFYAAKESMPTSGGRTDKNIRDFIKDGTYDGKYAIFRNYLATHLSKKSQLDVEESKKVVDNSMSAYMKKYYSNSYKLILIHKMSGILDYLELPDWIDRGIRTLYRKLFPSKRIQMDDFRSSMDVPSSKYYDDFNKIRIQVLSYSKK